jgi:hypothetical protein
MTSLGGSIGSGGSYPSEGAKSNSRPFTFWIMGSRSRCHRAQGGFDGGTIQTGNDGSQAGRIQ